VKRLDHGRRWVGFFKACAENVDGWLEEGKLKIEKCKMEIAN
jgi:hypothetical protein